MEFIEFLTANINSIRKITLSDLEKEYIISKSQFQIISTLSEKYIQKTYFENNQAFHKNFNIDIGISIINEEFLSYFRQALVQLDSQEVQFIKHGSKIKKKIISKKVVLEPIEHNRRKNSVYQEGEPQQFLIDTGIMDPKGHVKAKMQPKFRQVNRFLELCSSDLIAYKKNHDSICCVDIGCGKGYLTFALYDYLKKIGFKQISFVGIDLKKEVVDQNNAIAANCQMNNLKFISQDANTFQSETPVDCLVALHACNNATDMAIKLAIKWDVKFLYLAPCCHQFLFQQIKCDDLTALLKYGIFKERFAALVTDALRASHLENHGYDVEVAEFVDREDSLKNVLIKAVRSNRGLNHKKHEYKQLKKILNVVPWLETH